MRKIFLTLAILAGIAIFYISSLSFSGGQGVSSLNSTLYHFFAFFFFALFLLFAFKKNHWLLIIISVFYAASDEIHQLFVPGRFCSFSDFLIDCAGILLAALLYYVLRRNKVGH